MNKKNDPSLMHLLDVPEKQKLDLWSRIKQEMMFLFGNRAKELYDFCQIIGASPIDFKIEGGRIVYKKPCLQIYGCDTLISLPDKFISCALQINDCNNLEVLDKKLKTNILTITNCSKFKSLSGKLITEKFETRGCSQLEEFGQKLFINSIYMSSGSGDKFDKLPFINGLKNLSCSSRFLQEISNKNNIFELLNLLGCESLEKLPLKLKADKLILSSKVIKKIPENSQIGSLDIRFCNLFEGFGNNTKVLNLDIWTEEKLLQIPSTLGLNILSIGSNDGIFCKLDDGILLDSLTISSCNDLLLLEEFFTQNDFKVENFINFEGKNLDYKGLVNIMKKICQTHCGESSWFCLNGNVVDFDTKVVK